MSILSEVEMLEVLDSASNVLLLEPPYRRKYPPMGLMKIASRLRHRGVRFKFARECPSGSFDLVAVASLFTYDVGEVEQSVAKAQAAYSGSRILVGGVCATLLSKRAEATGADVFLGYSKVLDEHVPDYAVDWQIDERWVDFTWSFTFRGCPNRCPYCAVKKMEAEPWLNPRWRAHVFAANKPCAMVFDNNLSAAPREHALSLFSALARGNRRVCLDNGVDCKHVDIQIAEALGKLRFVHSGMRIAFDRIAEDGVFQSAVALLIKHGVPKTQIMSYVLFNFLDTPREADYRARECVKMGVHPYPQRFMPLNCASREDRHVGKHWNERLLQSFRYFWLMAGLHTKHEFFDWATRIEPRESRYAIGEEEVALWNAGT